MKLFSQYGKLIIIHYPPLVLVIDQYQSKKIFVKVLMMILFWGQNLSKKIPPAKQKPTNYFKKPATESFLISPTTIKKVEDIISIIESSKSIETDSIPGFIYRIVYHSPIITLSTFKY